MANIEIQKASFPAHPALLGLALLLLASGPPAMAATDAAVGPLSLQLKGPKPAALEAVVVRMLTSAGWQTFAASAELGQGGIVVKVPQGCLSGARLVVEFPDVFGISPPLDLARCAAGVNVNVWSRAMAQGVLEAPAGEATPGVGELLFSRCPRKGESHRVELEMPVAIEGDGRWQSLVPSTCGCFSLAAGDNASQAWHKKEGKPGGTFDLGARKLTPGAHLRARAVDVDGQALTALRIDVLTPKEVALQAQGAPRVLEDSGILRSAVTDAQGWIDLRGLPPGQFSLRAVPSGSKRPAFSAPLELAPRSENVIDPWVVAPTSSLEVQLTPGGLAWKEMEVVIEPQGIPSAKRQTDNVDPTGAAHFNEVEAGTWLIVVHRQVDGVQQEIARRSLKIPPGRHQPLVLPVRVE